MPSFITLNHSLLALLGTIITIWDGNRHHSSVTEDSQFIIAAISEFVFKKFQVWVKITSLQLSKEILRRAVRDRNRCGYLWFSGDWVVLVEPFHSALPCQHPPKHRYL